MRPEPSFNLQGGAFSRRQALGAGIARSTIARRLARGEWLTLTPRTYVRRGTLVTPLTRAWAGHLTTGGVVSHETAGSLHGQCPTPDAVHVTVARLLHVDEPGIVEHRVRITDDDVTARDGLPLTSPLRTLVDLLATSPRQGSQTLLFRAVQQRWIDEHQLRRQIEIRRGMHGTKQLRELADLLGTGAHSPAERVLHSILTSIPHVTWSANVPVQVRARRYVVDVAIPSHRIAIEVDGRRFHSDSATFQNDRERQNALVNAGWTILRFTWLDLVQRPEYVRRAILDAVAVSSVANVVRTEP